MITELTIASEYGDSLTLSMPGSSGGYLVKAIEGLDPVPVAIVSSPIATVDGEVYQASKREKRNIVLTIKLDQNYALETIGARRNRLHEIMGGNQGVTLTLSDEVRGEVTISGRVEEADSDLYTEDPTYVASIICFNPDFKSVEPQVVTGALGEGLMELSYLGTSPTGIYIHLDGPSVEVDGVRFLFEHKQTSLLLGRIEVDSPFGVTSTDGWDFVSVPLEKRFVNSGSQASRLALLNFDTLVWPTFIRGDIEYMMSELNEGTGEATYSITWYNQYGAL